jgi:hypothetical protein
VRCQSVVEYAIIFLIAVAALTAVLVGHEWTRIAMARGGGVGRRAAAVVASMVVTYVLACIPAFIVLAARGTPGHLHFAVGEVVEGYDAAGKLQQGDVIIAVDGNAVSPTMTPSLVERVDEAKGAPVTLTIRRDGGTANVAIQPKAEDRRWLLGIRLAIDAERDTNLGSAVGSAIAFPIERAQQEVGLLSDLITGRVDAGGPTRMVEEFARAQVVDPGWVRGLTGAASACFFALLVLVAIDLGRLVGCALSARRASR